MNSNDHRIRHEGLDRSTAAGAGAYSSVQAHLGSAPGKQTTSVATSVQLTPNARIFPVHLSRKPPVRVHFARSWLSGRQVLVSDRSPHPRSSYIPLPSDQAKRPFSAYYSTPATFPPMSPKTSLPPSPNSFKAAVDIRPTSELRQLISTLMLKGMAAGSAWV